MLSILTIHYVDDVPPADDTPTRGHKKKERTRRLLLDTASAVIAERGESFSVDDLASRAGVSHGTFYNYFSDRDALVAALVDDVVGAFTEESAAATADDDPAVRFATITAQALTRVAQAPDLARVALRLEPVQQALLEGGPFSHLRDDLAEGRASGRFTAPDDEATADVVVGSILMAVRRIVDDDPGPEYAEGVVRQLLRSLGVPAGRAATVSARAVAAAAPPAPEPLGP